MNGYVMHLGLNAFFLQVDNELSPVGAHALKIDQQYIKMEIALAVGRFKGNLKILLVSECFIVTVHDLISPSPE